MTHPVINDWQVDKGPFGVTIVRGVVVQRDERGNTIAGPETHQLLWESRGMFGITSNGTSFSVSSFETPTDKPPVAAIGRRSTLTPVVASLHVLPEPFGIDADG